MNANDKQALLYNLLEKLKQMAEDIPRKYQLRLPYDVLSSIAHVLLDNTVFEIVKELNDLQHVTERHLHQQRQEIVRRHKRERENLLEKHKEEAQIAICQGRVHVSNRLPILHENQSKQLKEDQNKELKSFDMRVLQSLDDKIVEQQSTLEQVGLPCFKVSQDPVELQLQLHILDFVMRIGGIEVPRRMA